MLPRAILSLTWNPAMHFEVPKASTFKEFGGEYLMIVISILTALGLEHGAQAIHHRHLAHEASQKIDAEIRANIDELTAVRAHNKTQVDKKIVLRDALLAEILAGATDDALKASLKNNYQGAYGISQQVPTLRREAWDVAVANQAVSWMPADELKRYSVIYAGMRDMQATNLMTTNNFVNGPRLQDAKSNFQMGDADPRETYRMLNQVIASFNSLNGNLANLQTELEKGATASTTEHH
jgi:hypothetical protein